MQSAAVRQIHAKKKRHLAESQALSMKSKEIFIHLTISALSAYYIQILLSKQLSSYNINENSFDHMGICNKNMNIHLYK